MLFVNDKNKVERNNLPYLGSIASSLAICLGIIMKPIQAGSLTIYQLEIGAIRTNCYLVSDTETKDTIIIDPADSEEQIAVFIKEHELNIKGVFLTHGHFDHIYGAVPLANQFRVSLYACEKEKELLSQYELNCSTMIQRPIEIEADIWVKDGKTIQLGTLTFQVIETPGHTKGSVCYYFKKDNILLSGDTLFLESVGRTDLPTANSQEMINSVKNKLAVLPEETIVLPGHGECTTIAYEKKNNPYMGNNFWE